MPQTVPNQSIIKIKKTPCQNNFLQVSIKEWAAAAENCGTSFGAFKLWLYLASNEIGYEKALSQVAFENATGVKKTAYYDAKKKLVDLGYLVPTGNNKYDFYTTLNKEENSVPAENNINSVQAENSAIKENSVQAENDNDSVQAENSVQTESNINSVPTENSGVAENNTW